MHILRCCAMVIFAFLFQTRSITVDKVLVDDVEFLADGILYARMMYKNAKPTCQLMQVRYLPNAVFEKGSGPVDVMWRWYEQRPGRKFFNEFIQDVLGAASLSVSLKTVLPAISIYAPSGYFYGLNSAQIGGFNELFVFGFSSVWLIQRLNWTSEGMFKMYFDSRMLLTPDLD